MACSKNCTVFFMDKTSLSLIITVYFIAIMLKKIGIDRHRTQTILLIYFPFYVLSTPFTYNFQPVVVYYYCFGSDIMQSSDCVRSLALFFSFFSSFC